MSSRSAAIVKGEGGLAARLDTAVAELAAVVADIDPAVMTGAEAERLMAPLVSARNVCEGRLAALAARVADTDRWRQAGARSAGAHLGSLTGSSAGAGARLADTGRTLETAPATRHALEAGRLSLDQAAHIAAAVAETAHCPRPQIASRAGEVEQRLLEVAAAADLARLHDAAARARQAARDHATQRRLQHRTRHLRKRAFDDGSVGGQFKLPPLVAGQLWAVLDKLTDRRFRHQASTSNREPRDAYAADALCHALGIAPSNDPDTGPAPAAQPSDHGDDPQPRVSLRHELVVIVDADSLRNGTPGPDGTCEIPGVGPIPVAAARDLLGHAGLNLIIKDGTDIAHITLGGRRLSKAMRLAMLAGHGWRCTDCATPYRLQNDHDTPYALTRHTRLDQLKPRCPTCHKQKTRTEAPHTIAAGRAHATSQRTAAALIAALTLIVRTRGP